MISDTRGLCYPFAVETAAMSLPDMRRTALAASNGERWLLYERDRALDSAEQAQLAWAGIDRFSQTRIPVDPRHNSKVDHRALKQLLHTLATK